MEVDFLAWRMAFGVNPSEISTSILLFTLLAYRPAPSAIPGTISTPN
jgi:hypothetical protein